MAAAKRGIAQIKPKVHADVVEVLAQLLASAQAGDVTGIVFGATLRGHHYITDILGACHRNPTHALGMLQVLQGDLTAMVKSRGSNETR